jgi:predicted ATP-grasp superfamily ATP-dependent carboligase
MRQAIAADFAAVSKPWCPIRVIVTLDSRLPDAPGPWTLERITADDHGHRLCQLARTADFTVVVAPETTGVLARLTRELRAEGARVMGSAVEAIELTGDKARLAVWLHNAGIDTPPTRTVAPASGLPVDVHYPAVLKPLDGAGSLNTFLLSGPDRIPPEARVMVKAVLQPYVPGSPMSASFLVGGDGKASLIGVGAQRVAMRDGQFVYTGGVLPVSCPGAAAPLRLAIESVSGLSGFVGIDFIWHEASRRATVLEINPRPTTSYVGLSRLLRRGTLARAWLSLYDTAFGDPAALDRLARRVHRQRRVSFDVDGSFFALGDVVT